MVAACVMTVFSSCQKDVVDEQLSAEKVRLEISVPIAMTKVVSGADETAINNYQVFVFNNQNVLEAYVKKNTADISLSCTMVSKKVVVLVNAPALTDITTLPELMNKPSLLADNAKNALVMEGMVSVDIVSTKDVSIEVPVYRKVAKVELVSLATAFELPQYRDAAFKVSSVYLINVPANTKYFGTDAPTLWFNKSKYVSSDSNSLIYDNMNDVAITSSSPYTAKNAFYCYPNPTSADSFADAWSPRNTRLVVEATLGNQKYYYPVTLPVLEKNKRYEVSLTITRPGSYVPDTIVDKFAADFTVTVKDWEKGASVVEEI